MIGSRNLEGSLSVFYRKKYLNCERANVPLEVPLQRKSIFSVETRKGLTERYLLKEEAFFKSRKGKHLLNHRSVMIPVAVASSAMPNRRCRSTGKENDRLKTCPRVRTRWRSNRRCNLRSQCFPRPQEDLPPLSLPLEDLPPLLPLPADFPPGGSAGSARRCEPEAVAPELAPDPASLGGELGSVDDATAPEELRALFSFCRCFLRSAFSWSVSGLQFICLARPGV